ncbi:solute carrier family 22 member 7 [Elysia marginata]|uniref:Solute carrier family 22 member 7 n=1 Tax=Elysia marginata TaxID=1093978 RepID=A0AAV4HND6_9GAST|nr:solute carrier family 22 member 7 [Elysia marginata]
MTEKSPSQGTISPYTCSDVELPIRSLKSNDLGFFSNEIIEEFNSTLSVTYDKCSVAVINKSKEIFRSACTNGYRYESKREKSFVTEWDLVCEKSALPEVTQTILNLGKMCGSFLFPALSDRYGRRPVFIICQLLSLGMGIATAFVPNYASFISMRLVEESIRWLSANDKHENAEKVLKKAAKTNSVDEEAVIRLYRREREEILPFSSLSTNILPNDSLKSREEPEFVGNETTVKGTSRQPREFSAFFTNRSIFIRTIIVMYIWFSDSVAYYGLLLLSSSLVDDLYLGFTLSVFSEIPAAVVFIVLNERYNMGRRRLTIVSHLLGGLFLLIASLLGKIPAASSLPGVSSAILVTSLVGKFGMVLGFNAAWLYTPELFPTTIRSTAYGIAVSAGQVGGVVAPYSITVVRYFLVVRFFIKTVVLNN